MKGVFSKLLHQRSFSTASVRKTKLHSYHAEKLGGKMVEFAGYDMPVQYAGLGVMKEHIATRESCGIFDVSHMGQTHWKGKDAAAFLEKMTVVDTQSLHPGKASLSLLMNENGGIVDDCIITKVKDDHFYVVLNAGCKDKDMAHMKNYMGEFKDVSLTYHSEDERSLIAVQGPKAQHVMEQIIDGSVNLSNLDFMEATQDLTFNKQDIIVSRCGYTGEDGFEVSVPNSDIEAFMEKLWTVKDAAGEQVATPVGLGARDSLRLEAGLCLYGHELNEDLSPIEAMLAWTISKRRKESFGFLGDHLVKKHIAEGVSKKRCGFIGDKVPVREGTELYLKDGTKVGMVTSGTKGPSIGKAIGMGYVDVPHNKFKTELIAKVRGKDIPVTCRKMPFVPSNYYKKQ